MSEKYNILITAPSLDTNTNVSGVATVVRTIINANPQHQYFHYLLGRPDKPMGKLKWAYSLLAQLLYFPSFVRKNQIQIVHQNLPFNPKGLIRESIVNFWCYLLKVPVVLHLHGGSFLMEKDIGGIYRWLAKSIFKHSKKIIVLSEIEQISLRDNHDVAESTVLLNSVDVKTFPFKKRSNSVQPVFLFLGRIHESKGVNDIVAAFRLLKQQRDFKFCLCGTGPLKDYFINECTEILGDDFEYRGIVQNTAKQDALNSADFFLLPSRYGEGLPMALLESMASGLIPIVTDDASIKYIIHHGYNGILVNKSDYADLFDKMVEAMDSQTLCETISLNARQTIESEYDIAAYIHKLNIIYDQCSVK